MPFPTLPTTSRALEGLDEDEKRALIHLLAKMRINAVTGDKEAAKTFLRQLASAK